MDNRRLLLIGGGGHCKSVLDSVYRSGYFEETGIIDSNKKTGEMILDTPVVGTDVDLEKLSEKYSYAFVTVGSVGNTAIRRKLYTYVKMLGYKIPNIIDPSASIAMNCQLGEGIFAGKHVVINSSASIENGAIINTAAIIEHDSYVGAFTHVSPGAVVCGNVKIADDVHVGANSTIIQGKNVRSNIVIGAGSVVTKDLTMPGIYVGVPANRCEEAK